MPVRMNEPHLYILCGLPFAGKSTLARELVRTRNFVLVEMDAINSERGLGLDGQAISPSDWDITYAEFYHRIDQLLAAGKPVIADAPNFTRDQRDLLREIARKYSAPSTVIYLNLPEATVRERWQRNRQTNQRYDVRDDDFALVVDFFQPPTDEENVIYYDQSLPMEEWIARNI